jgi:hypothetical protein
MSRRGTRIITRVAGKMSRRVTRIITRVAGK